MSAALSSISSHVPGHQTAHVALYDRNTALLLTGDSLSPGRRYMSDWIAYRGSMGPSRPLRLSRRITHVARPTSK